MLRYNSKAWSIKYSTPKVKLIFAGIVTIFIGIVSALLLSLVYKFSLSTKLQILPQLQELEPFPIMAVLSGVLLIILGFIIGGYYSRHTHLKIANRARRALYSYEYGNPLHLKDGERLPIVGCKQLENGRFLLRITAVATTVEDLEKLSSAISSALNKKLKKYAVIITNADVAYNYIDFLIDDVTVDRTLIFTDVKQMKQKTPTKIIVDSNTYIDLEFSGSMLTVGKTRSGKTTAIISILLQVLLQGADKHHSKITIIDPKQAELSQLPHVMTLDDGEATQILKALKEFAEIIKLRQKFLNDLSVSKGDVIHWWEPEAKMRPSFVFIDEYVSCRTLFPKKAEKGSDYCLATFDNLVKRIVTMGASAGCFMIISVAEASVEEAGVPSMIKNAMSTKLLFKPTLSEARLIWSKDKLENFSVNRVYNAGDCWFSSTDGKHDDVSYVHFPIMKFPVYRELGRLLTEYYNE